jgi:hypothetical protein
VIEQLMDALARVQDGASKYDQDDAEDENAHTDDDGECQQ